MRMLFNWKLHLFAALIIFVSELVGVRKAGIFVFMPILYAIILGGIVSYPKFKILSKEDMDDASNIFPIALSLLLVKIGLGVGPNLPTLMQSGGTLLFQTFGHFIGIVLVALPIGMLLGLGRETVGGSYSLGREVNVAIIAEKHGLSSPEGRGVMGVFICGTILGAMFCGILISVIIKLGIFHPFSLALGAGTGSISMSAAMMSVILEEFPQHAQQIEMYTGASNILTNVLGVYAALFITLPLARVLYRLLDKFRKPSESPAQQTSTQEVQQATVATSAKPNAPFFDWNKFGIMSSVLVITALLTVIGNVTAGKAEIMPSIYGIFVIYCIAVFALFICHLPGFRKLPVVFWVCIIAVLFSAPFFPGSAFITETTKAISFVQMGPPTLAYAGLALGKDLELFKKLSWRIVLVSLGVFLGTFLFGAIFSEIGLRVEGII